MRASRPWHLCEADGAAAVSEASDTLDTNGRADKNLNTVAIAYHLEQTGVTVMRWRNVCPVTSGERR